MLKICALIYKIKTLYNYFAKGGHHDSRKTNKETKQAV